MRGTNVPAFSVVVSGLVMGVLLLSGPAAPVSAAVNEALPAAYLTDSLPLTSVELVEAPVVDFEAALAEDEVRQREDLPPRYAIPTPAHVTPSTHGTWEDIGSGTSMWRVRIASEDALSINLGFTLYDMPRAGRLLVYSADGSYIVGPFTEDDNKAHGELWTPVVLSDDVVVEVTLPTKEVDRLGLELTSINVGYRGFGELLTRAPGYCNIDVVCPQGDDWREDISAVGCISTGGSTFCTGFMVNNTAGDGTPYFMSANHCGITTSNDQSLVVYWNYESPNCGDLSGGSLSDYQTGSLHLASYSSSDVTLVQLDDAPNPAHGVTFAGWDWSGVNPPGAVAIHQPDAMEKCISFEDHATSTTSYLGTSVPGDGTHVRVTDWDVGTTEPGSSGSPLFDLNHRIIGQLHGGYAACGNEESDWYGRLSVSWGSAGLATWLDPLGTGQQTLDLYNPNATGMRVTPSSGLAASGDAGGPFTPGSEVYTIENQSGNSLTYSVTKTQAWVTLTNASGTIPLGGTTDVTVSINSNANSLGNGVYTDEVTFVNETDHSGDTIRGVTLTIGVPSLVHSFPLDSDPGWTTEGLWAYGAPTGGGGQYGNPDPTSGHTGPNVYGYNLSGDYENSLPERHLRTAAIDCSDVASVSVKFWRWLNVEQGSYDHAYVRVSNDGSTWTTLFSNPGTSIEDNSWTQHEYDISAVADGEETVYLRWTMGTTDGSWQYSGWNIDDVEIWGIESGQSGVDETPSSDVALSPNYPNPFGPSTTIRFELPEAARVTLKVYDVSGRFVRELADAQLPAGPHVRAWDGRDESGAPVATGVYFCRFEAGARSQTRRMVLIR